MTLDEAITQAKEVAEEEQTQADSNIQFVKGGIKYLYDEKEYSECCKCAEEHRQLAEWLKELKRHREAWKKVKEEVKEMSWSLEAYVPDLDVREVDLDDVLNIIDRVLGEVTDEDNY